MIPKDIKSYYQFHSKFYNATRWAFLFGRNLLIKHFPDLPKEAQILDLGCGTGKHLDQLRKRYPDSYVTGVDLSDDMLQFVDPTIVKAMEIRNEYYTSDSFGENRFNLILCSYSLTMMDDIRFTLNAIKKHLKPNGILLVADFDSSPFNLFQKWMKKNHVSFEPNLFELLDDFFEVEFKSTRKAFFGLYTYSIFLGNAEKSLAFRLTGEI